MLGRHLSASLSGSDSGRLLRPCRAQTTKKKPKTKQHFSSPHLKLKHSCLCSPLLSVSLSLPSFSPSSITLSSLMICPLWPEQEVFCFDLKTQKVLLFFFFFCTLDLSSYCKCGSSSSNVFSSQSEDLYNAQVWSQMHVAHNNEKVIDSIMTMSAQNYRVKVHTEGPHSAEWMNSQQMDT